MPFYAGFDVSFSKNGDTVAVLAICDDKRNLVYKTIVDSPPLEPYQSGHLAKRELPALKLVWAKFRQDQPNMCIEVLLVDGNGVWHPSGEGLAVHIGRYLDLPTIGVSKSLLKLNDHCTLDTIRERCARSGWPVYMQNDGVAAAAILTGNATQNPIYVSVGYNIDLTTALSIVKKMCVHRVPEPVRQADLIGRSVLRQREDTKPRWRQGLGSFITEGYTTRIGDREYRHDCSLNDQGIRNCGCQTE